MILKIEATRRIHDDNRTASDEEVMEIAKLIAELRQGTFTDSAGSTRSLREDDFMVVGPYNAQVRRYAQDFLGAWVLAP